MGLLTVSVDSAVSVSGILAVIRSILFCISRLVKGDKVAINRSCSVGSADVIPTFPSTSISVQSVKSFSSTFIASRSAVVTSGELYL